MFQPVPSRARIDQWPSTSSPILPSRIRRPMGSTSGTGSRRSPPPAGASSPAAQECLRLAESAGCPTAHVTATRAAASLPFGALAPMLPASDHGEVGVVDDRSDLLRRLAAALVDRAGGRRFVFLVDDAHLLDDG